MQTEEFITHLTADGVRKPLPNPFDIAGVWLGGIVCYLAAVTLFLGIRPDIAAKSHQPMYLLELSTALVTAISAAYAASLLALPDVGQRPRIRFLPFAPMMVLVVLLGLRVVESPGHISLAESLRAGRYDCCVHIALFSILPAAVMFLTIEKAAPALCCWAGSMAALSASSFGYVLLRLTDASDNPTQLLVWYFVPVIAVTMIGMMLGGIFFKRSALWQ